MLSLCILAMPRTGSGRLCALLGNCPGLNVKGELFHPKRPGPIRLDEDAMRGLQAASGGAAHDIASLCIWRAAHPQKTLQTLYTAGGARPVVFKLFPGHLKRDLLSEEIFSHGDTAYVVLRRRPIESFISDVKAQKIGLYHSLDTTDVRPELDVRSFAQWAARMRDWEDWTAAELAARDLPRVSLSYEEHLCDADDERALAGILDVLRPFGLVTGDVRPSPSVRPRQDLTPRYQDRVSNWGEFESALRSDPAHAEFLDWAVRT